MRRDRHVWGENDELMLDARGVVLLGAGARKWAWLGSWCYAQVRLALDVSFFLSVWQYATHSPNNCSPINTSDIYLSYMPYTFSPPILPSTVPFFADYVKAVEDKGYSPDSDVVEETISAFTTLCTGFDGCAYSPVPAHQCAASARTHTRTQAQKMTREILEHAELHGASGAELAKIKQDIASGNPLGGRKITTRIPSPPSSAQSLGSGSRSASPTPSYALSRSRAASPTPSRSLAASPTPSIEVRQPPPRRR